LDIIEHIWSDTLELREGGDLPPLAVILSSLLAAQMICFTTKMGGPSARAVVSYAGDEVMPGASLSDVLFEEFAIEISDQTIVLVEPSAMSDAEPVSSQDLGQALGQILVELAGLKQDENSVTTEPVKSGFVHQASQPTEHRVLVSLVQ
jgi:hypothetical protein